MLQYSQRIEFGRNRTLHAAHHARRNNALGQPPDDAADPDIHFEYIEVLIAILADFART